MEINFSPTVASIFVRIRLPRDLPVQHQSSSVFTGERRNDSLKFDVFPVENVGQLSLFEFVFDFSSLSSVGLFRSSVEYLATQWSTVDHSGENLREKCLFIIDA